MTKFVKTTCNRCGTEPSTSHLTGSRIFYDLAMLSETHLCADCVLDLMSTDPTCENVMEHIVRAGDDHPFAAHFIYEARKGQGFGY